MPHKKHANKMNYSELSGTEPDIVPSRQALLRITTWIQKALAMLMKAICLVTGFSIGATLMLGVVYRYVLQSSLAWAAELPGILFPWLVMSGATLAAINRQHLGIDYFVARLNAELQHWISFAIHILLVVILTGVAIISLDMLEILSRQMTPVLYWPRSWAFAGLPVGLFALAIVLVSEAITILLRSLTEKGTEKVD
jgi:TRAP-type C4-dicarboxylate transport system permease small subunit